jgi:hypothetical protein
MEDRKDHSMSTNLASPSLQPRATANRANSLHSTGPRTAAGKYSSSRNALTHGLTSHTAVLPSEDPAAYQSHCLQFRNEYQPKTPTEIHLVQELADTAWRLNRVPLLEADLLARTANPPNEESAIAFDIVDVHRALATLGMHGQRLSRQFHNSLEQLREIQADRLERERRDLRDAAAILELHKHRRIPYDPAQDGFVFSNGQVEAHSQHLMRLKESRQFEYVRFDARCRTASASASS